jgi:hypothetical protein
MCATRFKKTGVIPAKAGIQRRLSKRHWVPAWPFLETSPFGLVFAGTTVVVLASRTLVMLNLDE